MGRVVLLVRGINLGRNKRIAMADLRALLADLGCSDVRTVLQSGNAVLTGDVDAARVEAAIAERTGHDVRCMLLTARELRTIVDGHPFADVATNGSRMMAHVLSAPVAERLLVEHDVLALDPDNARLGPRVIYQWCPDGVLEAPPVGGLAEKHLGVSVTARNWNTITKLAALLQEDR